MPPLDLRLLGGFRASRGAADVALPTRKACGLLAYLAMPPGRPRSREELTALLWGERPEAQARTSFRQALATLRRTAGPGAEPVVVVDHDGVLLNPEAVVVDVDRFERFVGMGTPGALAEAVDLYRGDFLGTLVVDEPGFEGWRTAQRERLHELALEALGRLLAFQIKNKQEGHAIQTALRLLELEPLQEAVHRTLMRLYVAQGRRAAALRQYRVCVEALGRDLGSQPEPETQALHRRIVGQRPLGMEGVSPHRRGTRSHPAPSSAAGRGATPGGVGSPLVGRRDEVSQLGAALERAWSEGGRLLCLRGEAGVGKSRLLQELGALASARGGRALTGQGYETQQILPFRPWIDAIRTGEFGRGTEWLSALSGSARVRLTRLFPELLETDAVSSPRTEDHGAVFEAVAELLAHWSARQPLVVVLDDLQWADEMSLRLLAFVGARLTDSPVLLAVSARDDDADASPLLGTVIQERARSGRLDAIAVKPLDRADAQHLIMALARSARAAACPPEVVDRVWELSEGNPFVIVESMRAIEPADGATTTTLGLPGTVREFLGVRFAQLSEIAQHLVSVAAVIGHESSVELLQRAAALSPRDTADALDELVRRRILEPADERFRFSHDRVRQVAYERLHLPRRALFHAAVGDALEHLYADRLGEVADRLAHHYVNAGKHDKTVTYLVRFADTARQRYGLEEAHAALQTALRHVEHLPAASRAVRRLEVLLQQSLLLALLGRFREIPALLLPHRATVASLGLPAITGPYHVRLGLTYSYHAEYEAAREEASIALTAAQDAGDEATLGQARYVLALTAYWLGEAAASVQHAREAIAVLRRSGPPHYLGLTYWILGSSYCLLGDFDLALEAEAECEAIGVATADARLQSFAALTAGWVLATRGDGEQALKACQRSLDAARDPVSVAGAKCFQGYAHLEMGAPDQAIALLEESIATCARIGLRQSEARGLVFLSQANLALGKIDHAREHAMRARVMHRGMKAAWGEALAIHALGRIALATGALEQAEADLRQAMAMFRTIGAKFEIARTAVDLARLAQGRRRRADASALLREARDTFRALGAPQHAERVDALAHRFDARLE